MFLSSYTNTSESLGEREMLWEQEPQASVSTAFSKTTRREKGKQLFNFDYQNVNSLCSRASSVSPSSYTNTVFNQSARVLS